MTPRQALRGWWLIALAYIGGVVWLDSRTNFLDEMPSVLAAFPLLAGATLLSLGLRFLRWHALLCHAGYPLPARVGVLMYVAGFALTASPGKVGELLRLRYLVKEGVPAAQVLAAFVFERLLDVVVVALLALPLVIRLGGFASAAIFVVAVVVAVAYGTLRPRSIVAAAARVRACRAVGVARVLLLLGRAFRSIRPWIRPRQMTLAFILGAGAWAVTAWAFAFLLAFLGVDMDGGEALALYPLAMLAGAASMLPGGLGSTEAAIIALLSQQGTSLVTASVAAIGIRLATLWLATALGIVAVAALEYGARRAPSRALGHCSRS